MMFRFLLARIAVLTSSRLFLAFILFIVAVKSYSSDTLTNRAQISLITISPGADLYSAFGHSTLWILDTEKGIDRVYNYGTFDFDQPNFYMNFVKGHLDYTLSAYSFQEQYLMTQYEGRGLSQQILNLDSGQKQHLYDFMEWNARPENMHYLYDFYLDNCSSRMRDVIQKSAGKTFQYDKSISTPYSFRDWMNMCLIPHPWSSLFMNIGLGAPADKETDYMTQMYLPINLKLAFSAATNNNKPLVKTENELLNPIEIEIENGSKTIWICMFSILSLAFFFILIKDKFQLIANLFDISLILFSAILGTLLTLLWCCTDHWVCVGNSDLLWANPLSFMYLAVFTKLKSNKIIYYFCVGLVLISFGYFSFAYLLPEKPILMLFPLILALQIRIVHRLYIARKNI